jgi:hypothetical protein
MTAMTALTALRRFAAVPPSPESCASCRGPLAYDHTHWVRPDTRQLQCVCVVCDGAERVALPSPWKRVPRRAVLVRDVRVTEADWVRMNIPMDLAFFVEESTRGATLLFFPSPAGATESPLDQDAWARIRDQSPSLSALKPDIEALLVHRLGAVPEYYRVSIDRCYRLVGVVRAGWQGFSGGPAVWRDIRAFMSELRDECGREAVGEGEG